VSPSLTSGYSSNRQRLWRRLRTGFLIAILPLLALATYLYWLTLPEYEPTGNAVYDAFAPVIYNQQLLLLVWERMRTVTGYEGNPIIESVITFTAEMIGKCIPIRAAQEPPEFLELDSVFHDSVDYLNYRSLFMYDFKREPYLQASIDKGFYDIGTHIIMARTSSRDDKVFCIPEPECSLYPNYSYWYFEPIEASLSKLGYLIDPGRAKPEKPTRQEIQDAFNVTLKLLRKCNEAPINSMPDWYPRDLSDIEGDREGALPNRRVAHGLRVMTGAFNVDIHAHKYRAVMMGYNDGYVDQLFLSEYIKYIHKSFTFEQYDTVPGMRTLDIKHYILYLRELESNVVDLTDSQQIDLDDFVDNLNAIEAQSKKMLQGLYKSRTVDESEIKKRNAKVEKICDYITDEFSKLTPPTIEGWLAGGAKLKPRQNAGGTQQP
jgi:hypothetical protein